MGARKQKCVPGSILLVKMQKVLEKHNSFYMVAPHFFVKRGGKSSKLQRMSETIIYFNFTAINIQCAGTIAESVAAQVQASFNHVKLWWEEKVARTEVRASRQTEQM